MCSAQKNFLPSNCGLTSISAAGLEAADLSTYLAAEDFVGRLFRWLTTSHIVREILYYTNISLPLIKPAGTVQPLYGWDQSNKPWWQICLFSALPQILSHHLLESLLAQFPSGFAPFCSSPFLFGSVSTPVPPQRL